MVVDRKSINPPSSLVGADVSAKLIRLDLVHVVGVVQAVNGGVTALAQVLDNVLQNLDRGAHLHIDMCVEQPTQHGVVRDYICISHQELVIAIDLDKEVAAVLWRAPMVSRIAVII